jgi:hypothetical protein
MAYVISPAAMLHHQKKPAHLTEMYRLRTLERANEGKHKPERLFSGEDHLPSVAFVLNQILVLCLSKA